MYACMIMPGLLTASTNKADHFGTSGVGLLCLSICSAPSACVCGLWLKNSVPPRKDVGTRVGARRTPEGAKRSAAVEAKRRLVQAGSRGTIDPERGELIIVSAEMERSGMKARRYSIGGNRAQPFSGTNSKTRSKRMSGISKTKCVSKLRNLLVLVRTNGWLTAHS